MATSSTFFNNEVPWRWQEPTHYNQTNYPSSSLSHLPRLTIPQQTQYFPATANADGYDDSPLSAGYSPITPLNFDFNFANWQPMPTFHASAVPSTWKGEALAHLPTISCLWGNCGRPIALDYAEMKDHLRAHMAMEYHVKGAERVCRWAGCVCAAKTAVHGRCHGQSSGQHPTHVQSVEQHVWDVHLGLRWPCSRCHQADFTTERSMKRHQVQGCQGVAPSMPISLFCAKCKIQLPSQADMNAHAPYCLALMSG